eukprot:5368907-Prymnesium_polylepis.1
MRFRSPPVGRRFSKGSSPHTHPAQHHERRLLQHRSNEPLGAGVGVQPDEMTASRGVHNWRRATAAILSKRRGQHTTTSGVARAAAEAEAFYRVVKDHLAQRVGDHEADFVQFVVARADSTGWSRRSTGSPGRTFKWVDLDFESALDEGLHVDAPEAQVPPSTPH